MLKLKNTDAYNVIPDLIRNNDAKYTMPEPSDQKTINDELRQWHYWWLITFSLLLIITFVYYLPLRFEHQAITDDHGNAMDVHMEDMAMDDHGDAHGSYIFHEETSVTEGLVNTFSIAPTPLQVGETGTLSFFVNEKPGNTSLPLQTLEIEHEKLMHVIGVRSDMNEFFHIHPEAGTTTVFGTGRIFDNPGRYKIWSEIKKDGIIHAFGHPEFYVSGEGSDFKKQVSFERHATVGAYQVFLQHDEVLKGVPTSLSFDVHNVLAEDVVLDDYLGTTMHLAIIKDDFTQFIHTHPENGHAEEADDHHGFLRLVPQTYAHEGEEGASSALPVPSTHEESINFSVEFPETGLYKAFAQFRPRGVDLPPEEALVAEFWIEVKEKKPNTISPWWMLLIISLIAIVLLNRVVKKYIGEEKV